MTTSRTIIVTGIITGASKRALDSRRPRPHYVVTSPTRIGAAPRRRLPVRLFRRLLASQA